MSSQVESRLLIEVTALKAPLRRLNDVATEEAHENWEYARWQRQDACQAVFDASQSLLEAIEDAERVLSLPVSPTRK